MFAPGRLKYVRTQRGLTQKQLAEKCAMRAYKGAEKERINDFNAILKSRIEEKQGRYNALMKNLSTGALPPEIVADIGAEMNALKSEIECLKNTEPPKDYTVEQITAWLETLKASKDEGAIHLLIDRIDIKNKTEINATSTLSSVLGESGCGGLQHIFPEILFHYFIADISTNNDQV